MKNQIKNKHLTLRVSNQKLQEIERFCKKKSIKRAAFLRDSINRNLGRKTDDEIMSYAESLNNLTGEEIKAQVNDLVKLHKRTNTIPGDGLGLPTAPTNSGIFRQVLIGLLIVLFGFLGFTIISSFI